MLAYARMLVEVQNCQLELLTGDSESVASCVRHLSQRTARPAASLALG